MTEEDFLLAEIDRLRIEYEKRIQPLVNRIVHLRRAESLRRLYLDTPGAPYKPIDEAIRARGE